MLRHALCSFLLCCGVALSAADVTVEGWLAKADSLRTIGLDAASLDLLKSAQHEFEANGDPCSSALLAERRARIHLDWKNPLHADVALTEAIRFSEQCPGLAEQRVGWRLSLAEASLEQGKRKEARTLLLGLARMTSEEGVSPERKALAVSAMEQLAAMSFEEGAYEEAEADHLARASVLLELDRREAAAIALGWAAVCHSPSIRRWPRLPERIRDNPPGGPSRWSAWWSMALSGDACCWRAGPWPHSMPWDNGPGRKPRRPGPTWCLRSGRPDGGCCRLGVEIPTDPGARGSLHAELAAREIEDAALREPLLVEALRTRSGLLATTGAHGPAIGLRRGRQPFAGDARVERARSGLFESEPWLAAIGDARTAMEARRAEQWQWAAIGAGILCLCLMLWLWQTRGRAGKAHKRLRRLQQQWLPGKQHQIDALATSGSRIAELAGGLALPAEMQRELADFGRLSALCSREMQYEPIDLATLCAELADRRGQAGHLDWSAREDVPFRGDREHLRDFLQVLLDGGSPCRMAVVSGPDGLDIQLDEFTEKGWWRQAMSLFAGDTKASHWSMVRMRCDRLGGRLNLDCDASGARKLEVSLPVYSA